MPLKALLDPQGKAVTNSMKNLNLNEIENVRIGKHITLEISAGSESEAKSKVDEVWVQKLHTHENGMWKDSVIDRNKRKINSVVMKNGKNNEI